eukprot:Lithocolla_globosa_v1_NODE_5138_length_1297_cov_14.843800.p1 type:complete len:373 gc:universal NODE_5138_length_1297_cov_14.843800:1190-72(-)
MDWVAWDQGRKICFVLALPFAVLGIVVTFYSLYTHWMNYRQPMLQRYTVRILWMVIVFSVMNILALVFKEYSVFFYLIRDIYSAYVTYTFFTLIVMYLDGESSVVLLFQKKHREGVVARYCFCCCLLDFENSYQQFNRIKFIVLQFPIFMILISSLQAILSFFDMLTLGQWAWNSAFVYISVMRIFSVIPAMVGFISFFNLTRRDHVGLSIPLALKFACVQLINLLSLVQGTTISLVFFFSDAYSDNPYAMGGEDLQLCILTIEVGILSLFHLKAFSVREFQTFQNYEKFTPGQALADMFQRGDFVYDLANAFGWKKKIAPEQERSDLTDVTFDSDCEITEAAYLQSKFHNSNAKFGFYGASSDTLYINHTY